MPQFISGKEIAHTKESEHCHRVQTLIEKGIVPKLAIIQTIDSSVIDMYVRVKKTYADKIGVLVEHYNIDPSLTRETIERLNADIGIHGIIVQLPLHESFNSETILNRVTKIKDVDGLAQDSSFVPPTVQSILWLMNSYVSDLATKEIALVGRGKLVGSPLEKELQKIKIIPKVFIKNDNLEDLINYDVIVSATGVPHLLESDYVASGTYVFDAGTAEENGAIYGDASLDLYERDDIFITPTKGGVGILTVRALFENVLAAAEEQSQ